LFVRRENLFTNPKIDVCPRAHFAENSADENTMQYLDTRPTPRAGLPVIRQGRYLACALDVFSMIARPEARKIAE
jgi:hypothetical protein